MIVPGLIDALEMYDKPDSLIKLSYTFLINGLLVNGIVARTDQSNLEVLRQLSKVTTESGETLADQFLEAKSEYGSPSTKPTYKDDVPFVDLYGVFITGMTENIVKLSHLRIKLEDVSGWDITQVHE